MNTPTKEDLINLLAESAQVAWYNTVSGCNSPAQQFYYERMGDPQVGDLVCEITSRNHRMHERVGRLIEKRQRPVFAPFEWDEEQEGRPCPTETVWVLQLLLDGSEFEWTDAKFVVIPEDAHRHRGGCRSREGTK